MLSAITCFAQKKLHAVKSEQQHLHYPLTPQLKDFYGFAAEANVLFNFPAGFKELEATDDEDFSFDYAMGLPGKDFEIWLQVKSQKKNWDSYQYNYNMPGQKLEHPDSAYKAMGLSHVSEFSSGDDQPDVRCLLPKVLKRYNADEGKSYLISLQDSETTKHFKYALLIALQKNHTGTIIMVCFTNDKGPEFFKNVDKASHSVRFKNTPLQ